MSDASGLAASIRGATDSETFDLAGQSTSTITTNITNAFKTPFPISEMIRITLVTGAGKLGRQKYDENAAKAVTTALRDLGFEEDRGASCVKECAGSFKLQHDTGKNLKTVVVFPRIQDNQSISGTENDGTASGSGGSTSLFPKGSPEEMIAMSSKTVFEGMVKSRCQTWTQKKGCLSALGEVKKVLLKLDEKLLQGIALEDFEQEFYDSVSAAALEEKEAFVRDRMHQHVDDGTITSTEKVQLLGQVTERLDSLTKEIADAEKANQAKKLEKLRIAKEKAEARKVKISQISPKSLPPLKHQAEIFQLRSELKPLQELENNAKGRLLSLKETQSLARKDEILAEIANLEEKSRGWYEEDDIFQARITASRAAWEAQDKSAKKVTKKPAVAAATSSSRKPNAWNTTSVSKPRAAPVSNSTTKSKPKANGGGVFAAMMMDSDSD